MDKLALRESEMKSYARRLNLYKSPSKGSRPKIELSTYENLYTDEYLVKNLSHRLTEINDNYLILKHEYDNLDLSKYNKSLKSIRYLLNYFIKLTKNVLECEKWDEKSEDEWHIFENSMLINNKNDSNLLYYLKKILNFIKFNYDEEDYKFDVDEDKYHRMCWIRISIKNV